MGTVGMLMPEQEMSSPLPIGLPSAPDWSGELSRRFMWLRSRAQAQAC